MFAQIQWSGDEEQHDKVLLKRHIALGTPESQEMSANENGRMCVGGDGGEGVANIRQQTVLEITGKKDYSPLLSIHTMMHKCLDYRIWVRCRGEMGLVGTMVRVGQKDVVFL